MQFQPIGDRVLIKRHEREKRKGGITLPDSALGPVLHGDVLAIGNKPNGFEVKVGDKVVLPAHANEIKLDGESYVLIKESEILAVL